MSSESRPPQQAVTPLAILDVVELTGDAGRWPAGTIGTIIEADRDHALVEISDDRGHTLDLITLPHQRLLARSTKEPRTGWVPGPERRDRR